MPPKKGSAAKDLIYQKIRDEIITGKRSPGERLSIEELKNQFGTSVTPVRDALQMLSQEDLVTIKPRSGYYITRVTLKQLNDILELRTILELAAVERAAENITDEQIEELEHIHAGYTDDRDETYSRYTDENKRFHCLIAKASGNIELTRQLEQIHDRLVRYMLVVRPGEYMVEMHSRLIEKLKAHDPIGARKTLSEELTTGKNVMIERIIKEESGSWHLGSGAN